MTTRGFVEKTRVAMEPHPYETARKAQLELPYQVLSSRARLEPSTTSGVTTRR